MNVLTALIWFGGISIALILFSILRTYAVRGFGFGWSSNRPVLEESAFELRLNRTIQNQTEAAAYIVPVLIAAHLSGVEGPGVQMAAFLIVLGRGLFAPLYLSGVPFIRVPAFVMAAFSTLYLIYAMAV